MAETPIVDTWERHVHSPSFDDECRAHSKRFLANSSVSDYSSERSKLWEPEDDSSSISSVETSGHDVAKLEAFLYYFGIRGRRRRGPKLIYRTSKDVFTPPSGPEQDPRYMQLLPVYEHDALGKEDLWPSVRSEVVQLLDQRNIKLSSVDLVRFRWEEQHADGHRKIVTTPVTIWVGVLPDTLPSEIALHSSKDILNLLKGHGISDIEVAYRESVFRPLTGPQLFAAVSDRHPLKDVIDPVTTALALPIAGLKTPHMQGTLSFYFRVNEALYGVTARHVLFPEEEGNDSYTYVAGPKKEVVLMGDKAFDDLLVSIQANIGILNNTVTILEKKIKTALRKAEGSGPSAEEAALDLAAYQTDQDQKKVAIEELKMFYVKMKKEWTELNDRIIGYVVWSPPISVSTPPHGYTKDVCVIKLDEKKFLTNFKGNVIDLGTEIEGGKFMSLMYPRNNAQSEFDYPGDRLFRLRAILSAAEIAKPNNQDHNGDPVRFVLKRGLSTQTMIGRLTGFESFVRRYNVLGNLDSVEAAIYPYNNDSGPFSRGGDSGALIADVLAKFVALLTGGTGPTDSSDITYGTPMYWLWDVIKAQFTGANLYFDLENN